MTGAEITLALLAGAIVGLVLGLMGGGGSILAVPLLVYVVGVKSTHAGLRSRWRSTHWRNFWATPGRGGSSGGYIALG